MDALILGKFMVGKRQTNAPLHDSLISFLNITNTDNLYIQIISID